jgi:PAS domain S-box-containing protein
MVVSDARTPDYPIVLANKAFLDLTGYAAEEVIGRNCRFLQGPATSRVAVAEIRAGLSGEQEVNVEILNYRKDGSSFWNRLHISPIHDDDGRLIYMFASQIDNTRFRKIQALEESEHRLMMEVDHRSKNVLAIVDSIVRLSDTSDPRSYAASIQQRVHALASMHSLFSERGWKNIPLADVISQQVKPYGGNRVTVIGPRVMLSAVVLQPIGLIFHELVTNAARHGALAETGGSVSVDWARTDNRLDIIWKEDRILPTDGAVKRGFGTVMVDAMVERQLNGRIERRWAQDHLTVALSLNLSSDTT